MKLYADMVGGAAGDMIMGAFVDCGLPLEHLQKELDKLNIPDLKLSAEETMRKGFRCVKLDVQTPEEHHHRTFLSIREMIENSELSVKVKELSIKIFRRLAEAEGKAHAIEPEKVHFHEVGAADSIADIVGSAVGLEYFDAEGFYHSEFLLGSGTIECSHGIIPLPAPATLNLMEGFRFRKLDIAGELTTPTGAAIITALSQGFLPQSPQIHSGYGIGAGTKEYKGIPAIFRLWKIEDDAIAEAEIVIEANIDDMIPEAVPNLIEKLMDAGAMDAYFTAVNMKKGRPGILITITAKKSDLENLSHELFLNSTTIGLRWYSVNRIKLKRGTCKMETPWGKVDAKWVEIDGKRRVKPEFEECKRIADENNVPFLDVLKMCEISQIDNPQK